MCSVISIFFVLTEQKHARRGSLVDAVTDGPAAAGEQAWDSGSEASAEPPEAGDGSEESGGAWDGVVEVWLGEDDDVGTPIRWPTKDDGGTVRPMCMFDEDNRCMHHPSSSIRPCCPSGPQVRIKVRRELSDHETPPPTTSDTAKERELSMGEETWEEELEKRERGKLRELEEMPATIILRELERDEKQRSYHEPFCVRPGLIIQQRTPTRQEAARQRRELLEQLAVGNRLESMLVYWSRSSVGRRVLHT